MFHRVNVLLMNLNKKLLRFHLFHKKLRLQSLQIFLTFKFNVIFTLLPYITLWQDINCNFNTRVSDFKLIHPCSSIHIMLNSHYLPVQTYHNNFILTLSNFFGEYEEIQRKLYSIISTLLPYV